jgi:hypothetical protein
VVVRRTEPDLPCLLRIGYPWGVVTTTLEGSPLGCQKVLHQPGEVNDVPMITDLFPWWAGDESEDSLEGAGDAP